MSELIPLKIPFGHYIFGNDSYTANEPPKEYQEIEALPTLKAKLEYFNKNVCSLAHSSEQATDLSRWKEPLSVMHRQPCKCGKHTPADFELFQEMRAKELKRLTDELNQLETYGEKVAYLITQPGFSIKCLIADEDFDLSPHKRPPADIEAFNELSKAEFERSYFPKRYRGALFSREKETITARLAKADDPVYQVKLYRQKIEAYTRYKQPDELIVHGREMRERELFKKKGMEEYINWLFRDVEPEYNSTNRRAKDTFLKCAAGIDAAPNLCAEPLYDEDWEAIEHGRQLYRLYQWLGQWQPGKEIDDTNTSEAAELKYCADIYALYHWIMIKMKRCQAFRLNDFDKWPKKDIQAAAETLYLKGRDWWKPNTFYKGFKKANETPMVNFPMVFGAEYKQKLIAISGNDPAVIEHLKGYPD